jgi:hypothetical protein
VKILDKAKAAAETAAAKAKEGVEDVQAKRELGQAYDELGKIAFELIGSGEISHARFEPVVEKIKGLLEKLEEHPEPEVAHDPSQPPAMPV